MAGTVRPMPRPESRGNAHPGSEQERKRHCADRGGLFPIPNPQSPGRVREPADSFPGLPKVSQFLEKGTLSAREGEILLLFSKVQLRF